MKRYIPLLLALLVFTTFAGSAHAVSQLGGPCHLNADCSGNLVCPNSTCQSDPNLDVSGSGGIGTACRTNNDCSGTYYCAPDDTCQVDSSLPGNGTATGGTPSAPSSGSGSINTQYLQGYKNSIDGIINNILAPLLISVAFIFFLWGVYKYFIQGAANPDDRKEGAQFVLWAVIGFVIIFSVWGIVSIVAQTLGLNGGNAATNGLHAPTL